MKTGGNKARVLMTRVTGEQYRKAENVSIGYGWTLSQLLRQALDLFIRLDEQGKLRKQPEVLVVQGEHGVLVKED